MLKSRVESDINSRVSIAMRKLAGEIWHKDKGFGSE